MTLTGTLQRPTILLRGMIFALRKDFCSCHYMVKIASLFVFEALYTRSMLEGSCRNKIDLDLKSVMRDETRLEESMM